MTVLASIQEAVEVRDYGHYIDGEWVPSDSGAWFETRNPTTGDVLARFPRGVKSDVDKAIEAAEAALPHWKKVPAPKRGEILLRAAEIMRTRKDEIGAIVTMEMGKVIAEGRGDVQEAIDFLEYIAGEGRRMFGETTPSELPNKFCMTVRQPIGVVGCITPWNFPTAIPIWKLGAALITGNTVVFKPAEQTPLCMAKIVEVFEEAGLPAGVLNVVHGFGEDVGAPIVEDPRVKAISFTGGMETGAIVYTSAAKYLKPVELELGGKNPQIVMPDANLELALDGVLFGAFGTSGQRCTATSRLILHEDIYDEFLEMLVDAVKTMKQGDPIDPDTDIGPVIDDEAGTRILGVIEDAKRDSTLVIGGERRTGGLFDNGFFIAPTIFETTHGTRISKEEIFGPVLSVIKVSSFEEALHVANDIDYGLSSSIYTKDVNRAFQAIEALETGITYINAPTIGAEVHLPFGGTKGTGNGGREAGSTAIDEFSEIKTVFIDYSNKLQKAQIED